MPSVTTVSSLIEVVNDEKVFYRLRMDAVQGVAKSGLEQLDWIGMTELLTQYQDTFCFRIEDKFIPKSNDYSNIQSYFLKKVHL